MAKITKMCVGESLIGEGNEVAHIDLIIGPRGSAVETAFANALTNNKDGFTTLLAVVAPNLLCKPATVLFNKVTIKGAKQAVQMFGPAQHAVAKAVANVKGTTIIGGGDSIAAIKKAGLADRITHISTGGGASLEFLGGRTLPGVAALSDR